MFSTACLFIAALLIHEWVSVGLIADPGKIRAYPFGTEQGWNYVSPSIYAWSALGEAIGLLGVAGVLLRAWWVPGARAWPGYVTGHAKIPDRGH